MSVTRLGLLSIAARSNTTIVRDWRYRTGENKLVAAVKKSIARATRDHSDAMISTVKALLSKLTESDEKVCIEVELVLTSIFDLWLPFKTIDAITAVAMAEQLNITTTSMRVIARFLRRVFGRRILPKESDMRAIGSIRPGNSFLLADIIFQFSTTFLALHDILGLGNNVLEYLWHM
jgi:hypothetical protein